VGLAGEDPHAVPSTPFSFTPLPAGRAWTALGQGTPPTRTHARGEWGYRVGSGDKKRQKRMKRDHTMQKRCDQEIKVWCDEL